MRILPKLLQANFLIGIISLLSCTVQVPSHVIQPDDMENLLYDYHLMQAMAGDLKTSERFKRNLYEQYVFEKHHVSEAEFDSSLVWYMRNPKNLESIYKNLNKRFTDKKAQLEASVPPGRRIKQLSPYGDSVDIWDDYRLFRLNITPLNNKMTINMVSDSNYHANDSFEWLADILFLQDTTQSRAVMSLTAIYDDDTIGNSLSITHSGKHSLTLRGDSTSQVKELTGSIYYYPTKFEENSVSKADTSVITIPTLLLSDIKLMRYHCNKSIQLDSISTQAKDSISAPKTSGKKEEPTIQKVKSAKRTEPTRVHPASASPKTRHANKEKIRFESVR